jgi:ketosteroid isomerase-like protein
MPAAVDPDADVQRLNDDYCAAYNAGEVEKLLAFLAEDALTLSPDQAPVRGREAHRKYFEVGLARETHRKLTLSSIRGQRAGDLLYDGGEWTNTVTAADGTARSASGYYLTVYRREGSGWKAVVTTFNFKQ